MDGSKEGRGYQILYKGAHDNSQLFVYSTSQPSIAIHVRNHGYGDIYVCQRDCYGPSHHIHKWINVSVELSIMELDYDKGLFGFTKNWSIR